MIKEYKGYTPEKGEEYLAWMQDHLEDGYILNMRSGMVHRAHIRSGKKDLQWCRHIAPELGHNLNPEDVMKSGVLVSDNLEELKKQYKKNVRFCGSCCKNMRQAQESEANSVDMERDIRRHGCLSVVFICTISYYIAHTLPSIFGS